VREKKIKILYAIESDYPQKVVQGFSRVEIIRRQDEVKC
jgi:hypothetical protein